MLKNETEDAVWINLSHDTVHWQCAANSNEIVGSIKAVDLCTGRGGPWSMELYARTSQNINFVNCCL